MKDEQIAKKDMVILTKTDQIQQQLNEMETKDDQIQHQQTMQTLKIQIEVHSPT